MELQGSGVGFEDVAASLASNLKVDIGKARAALAEGRVKLADGAKAMRDAVEKKFGGINIRQMLSLAGLAETLRKKFSALTDGVNLAAVHRLLQVFDTSTVEGAALKTMISTLGGGLVKTFVAAEPYIKKFMQGMIIGTLKIGIKVLELRNFLRKTFAGSDILGGMFTMNGLLKAGEIVVTSIATSVAFMAVSFAALGAVAYASLTPIMSIGKNVLALVDLFREIDWAATGSAIVDGLIDGLKSGIARVQSTVGELAERIKVGFKDALRIHSPSKVFAGFGENTAEGFEQGVESKTPDAARALDSMASPPEGTNGGPATARGGSPTINLGGITINVSGGGDAAKALTSPSFLAQLTKAIEGVLVSAGVPARA
jgi:hypothetical protein